MIPGNCR